MGKGCEVWVIDRLPARSMEGSPSEVVDLRDRGALAEYLRREGPFDAIHNVAAELAHEMESEESLWESNVIGTKNLAEMAIEFGTKHFVFVSSNCLWGRPFDRPVTEEDVPEPIEVYGRSKWAGEKILQELSPKLHSTILRTPTITSSGRLGLLAILFEFIQENRRIYTVGRGENRYQFVDANDLAEACWLGSQEETTEVYNVGSENVKSLREVYQYVIDHSGSTSKIVSLPKGLTLFLMRLAHQLGISPLGPYHYRMIAESFEFDTTKIRERLGWKPTRTNEEILFEAYQFFASGQHLKKENLSTHSRPAAMGVIKLVKWLS